MYNSTAHLYDRIAAMTIPYETSDLLNELLTAQGISPPANLADLGCGTGVLSMLMADKGWFIYGVEQSEAMLEEATVKLNALSKPIQEKLRFVQGDITNFKVEDDIKIDAAICMHNTVNHLFNDTDLERLACSVYRALGPKGILIFDSDTEKTFVDYFNHDEVVVWDNGKELVSRRCSYNQETCIASHVATVKRYNADQTLETISEEAMTLRYYRESDILECFQSAGFELLNLTPFNPSPEVYAGFIPKGLWVFRKP